MEYFKKLGATRLAECWGDDVPKGEVTDFYNATQAKDDETVIFSWVEYPDTIAPRRPDARNRLGGRVDEGEAPAVGDQEGSKEKLCLGSLRSRPSRLPLGRTV